MRSKTSRISVICAVATQAELKEMDDYADQFGIEAFKHPNLGAPGGVSEVGAHQALPRYEGCPAGRRADRLPD